MNENLNAIALASGIFALHDDYGHLALKNGWDADDHDDVEQKFAELILQKCIEICQKIENDTELSDDSAGGFRDGALLCATEIKEFFGLK